MRYFLILILFLFSNVSLTAESQGGRQIANYDIEGFRIGDSLLDTYSEREIKNNREDWYDDFGTYTVSTFERGVLNFQFLYKVYDKNYVIYGIDKAEKMSYNKCLKKLKGEEYLLKKTFPNAAKKNYGPFKHWADSSNKSIYEGTVFTLKSDDIVDIQCIDWSSNVDWEDNYRIRIWEKNAEEWYERNT